MQNLLLGSCQQIAKDYSSDLSVVSKPLPGEMRIFISKSREGLNDLPEEPTWLTADLGSIKMLLRLSVGCGQGRRQLGGQCIFLTSGHELSNTLSTPIFLMYLHQSQWMFPRDEFDLLHLCCTV